MNFLGTRRQPLGFRVGNHHASLFCRRPTFPASSAVRSPTASVRVVAATIAAAGWMHSNTVGASATIGGGTFNSAAGACPVPAVRQQRVRVIMVAGGRGRIVQSNADYAMIGGGLESRSSSDFGTVPRIPQYDSIQRDLRHDRRRQVQHHLHERRDRDDRGRSGNAEPSASTIGGGEAESRPTGTDHAVVGGFNNLILRQDRHRPSAVDILARFAPVTAIGGGYNNAVQITPPSGSSAWIQASSARRRLQRDQRRQQPGGQPDGGRGRRIVQRDQ